MGGRSTSSIMMMSALIITWFSYLLLWMCFPSRTPTSAKAQVVTNTGQNITVDYLPSRPDGVIFISHAASGPAREAVYILSRFGYQVLVGVKDKIERRSFLYSLRKGIELIDFDVSDPSTYPPLIYRLRHIRRDLDRPIVGVLINLADELRVAKTKAKDAIDSAFLEERYRAVSKNPFRIVQALLELNRHQVTEDNRSKRKSKRDAWLSDKKADPTSTTAANASSTVVPKYPWNAEAFRITILTRDYRERELLDPSSICDLDCLQQRFFVDYVRTLLRTESQVVNNASLSVVHSSWEVSSVQTASQQGIKKAGDIIGFAQGIDWVVDLSGESSSSSSATLVDKSSKRNSNIEQDTQEKEKEKQELEKQEDIEWLQHEIQGKQSVPVVPQVSDSTDDVKEGFYQNMKPTDAPLQDDEQITRALVHSFLSRRPWANYEIEDYRSKKIALPRFPM